MKIQKIKQELIIIFSGTLEVYKKFPVIAADGEVVIEIGFSLYRIINHGKFCELHKVKHTANYLRIWN